LAAALAALSAALYGCASITGAGWTTLIDGDKGLDNFKRLGDANWRAEGGAVVADIGKGGFLITPGSYKDFELRAEFRAETNTNSGIFIRCSDAATVTAGNAYEVNIWDIRPDPKYGAAGIVNFAAVPVPPVYLAGGRWNTFEIVACGAVVTVRFNGVTSVTMDNDKFAADLVALQFGAGVQDAPGGPIRWRKVAIKAL